MKKEKILLVIGGATATGKTGVAIELAKKYNAQILSADSRQFYREMSIGTAKPSGFELQQATHHFINSLGIVEKYSVGQYEKEAIKLLEAIFEKDDIAILAGGSGLFIKAVCEGFDYFPEVSEKIQKEVQKLYDEKGVEALQEELKKFDPQYYEVVDLDNYRRLIRALAVIRETGKPFSSFRKSKAKKRNFTPLYICLQEDREILYERINKRVDEMIKNGLFEEVKALYKFKEINALQTVGYSEIFDFLDDKITKEKAVELIKRNTRRYAKRQMTWFRNNGNWTFFAADDLPGIIDFIEKKLLAR